MAKKATERGCAGPPTQRRPPRTLKPAQSLPVKYAFECSVCPLCEEPFCDECSMHYADCKHPGPHGGPDEDDVRPA